ncbi:MAG: DUF5615 family PIN-like protein [Planctomycetota bacterium]
MRLLADENFPAKVVVTLRQRGHDVAWVRTESPGSSDPDVLARAVSEERVLVTFDKDFGELAYRAGLPAQSGVVLFRFHPVSPAFVVRRVVAVLESRDDWAGHFSVVEEARLRMSALPGHGEC